MNTPKIFTVGLLALLTACGGGGSGSTSSTSSGGSGGSGGSATGPFAVAGFVTGLLSNGLVLSLTASGSATPQSLTVASNAGNFVFPTKLAAGTTYTVAVTTNPANSTCTVSGASGTITNADVNSVGVTCTFPGAVDSLGSGYTPGSVQADMFATINQYRTQCGLPAFIENSILDKAEQAHAQWMQTNNVVSDDEDGALYPNGFTGTAYWDRAYAQGYPAGLAGGGESGGLSLTNVGHFTPGQAAAIGYISAVYHQIAALWPAQYIGIGASTNYETWSFGDNTVMDFSYPTQDVMTFPCDGVSGLSATGADDPTPPNVTPWPADPGYSYYGTPVTVVGNAEVLINQASYTDQSGNAVANINILNHTGASTNADPNNEILGNQAVVYPKAPLNVSTTYTVSITGTVGGKPFTKTFRFSTDSI